MEMFFFDAYLFAENIGVMETLREDEFAPVKNPLSAASNTAKTAREALSDLFKRWLKAGGCEKYEGTGSDELVEIDFKVSYGGENMGKVK